MPNVRKPDNVHRLNGTYDPARHGDPDTKPDWSTDAPDIPDCLDELAREEWERTMRDAPAGVLTRTDRTILTQYCMMVSRLFREGDDFTAADHTQLRLMQQELGFTPISRGKIGGQPKQESEDGFRPQPK